MCDHHVIEGLEPFRTAIGKANHAGLASDNQSSNSDYKYESFHLSNQTSRLYLLFTVT